MNTYARYDADGKYIWFGTATVGVDISDSPGIYVGVVDMQSQYHDAASNAPVNMPDRPSEYHTFNYRTKTWAFDEQKAWFSIRQSRNRRLADCDWTTLSDVPLTPEKKAEWAAYRQALRDVPEQSNPLTIVWPVSP